MLLKMNIEERACDLAAYIIESRATVRAAARKFGISKSTVHKDLSERLEQINRPLYLQVKEVLDFNKSERHIRGGLATKEKYSAQKKS
jgi:putative DeoR family transcriptional regulator (stage III sporulation protein D)